jgi:hypothetical protein
MAQIIPNGAIPVTALIAEAQRELDMRRQVYWSRVRAGHMRQADADARIALMAATVWRLTVTATL